MEMTLEIPREDRVRLVLGELDRDDVIVEIPNEDCPPDEVLELRISTL